MQISPEELEEFTNEALELLHQAEASLMAIEDGAEYSVHYDSIFRALHSIKGASGMLSLSVLNAHLHKIEDHFAKLKHNNSLTSDQCSYFLKAIDTAKVALKGEEILFDYEVNLSEQVLRAEGAIDAFIIDDESDLLEILGSYLSKEKISWKSFTNPREALEAIKLSPPRIVLTDLTMPVMDGLSLSKEIKKIHTDMPIIMISGFLDREALLEATRAGITGFVEKPVKQTTLINQVKQALVEAEMAALLDKTIKIILFQLPEIEEYLTQKGKIANLNLLKTDVIKLMERKRMLKQMRTT